MKCQLLIIVLFSAFFMSGQLANKAYELTPEEKKLYELLIEYRKKNKLKSIPLSSNLTLVAKEHVKDLHENVPHNKRCNMHSWSKKGNWSACCYTADHKQAQCMWNKPRELSDYKGDGYEIVYGSGDPNNPSYEATAEKAIEGWKKSVPHNEVMVNKGIWKKIEWNAVGVGMYKGYACIWFGRELDSN